MSLCTAAKHSLRQCAPLIRACLIPEMETAEEPPPRIRDEKMRKRWAKGEKKKKKKYLRLLTWTRCPQDQPVPKLLEQCGTPPLAPGGVNPTPKALGWEPLCSERVQGRFAMLGSTWQKVTWKCSTCFTVLLHFRVFHWNKTLCFQALGVPRASDSGPGCSKVVAKGL